MGFNVADNGFPSGTIVSSAASLNVSILYHPRDGWRPAPGGAMAEFRQTLGGPLPGRHTVGQAGSNANAAHGVFSVPDSEVRDQPSATSPPPTSGDQRRSSARNALGIAESRQIAERRLASDAESQSIERKVDGVERLAYQGRPGIVVAKNEGRSAREPAQLAEELRELFGQHCKEARMERRLLQQEVAALSGIAQSDIARIEGGQKNITLDRIMRILRVVDREFARRIRGDLNSKFGENVRTARKQIGLSQAKLAERAGVRTQYISKIEIGSANVTLEMVAKVALAIGLDPNQLLERALGQTPKMTGPAAHTTDVSKTI